MDAGIGESMLIGAALGGGMSAIQGKNPLQGALMGGAMGGLGGAFLGPGSAVADTAAADSLAGNTLVNGASEYMASGGFGQGVGQVAGGATGAGANTINSASEYMASGGFGQGGAGSASAYNPTVAAPQVAAGGGAPTIGISGITDWIQKNPYKAAALGIGGITLGNMLTGGANNYLTPYQPPTADQYGLGRGMSAGYRPSFAYQRYAAGGSVVPTSGVAPADLQQNAQNDQVTMSGIQSLLQSKGYADGGLLSSNPNPQTDYMGGGMYPMSQQQVPAYATPSQMPTSAQQAMASYEPKTNPLTGEATAHMAKGGIAELAVGGKLLQGAGDGMSDSLKANIGGQQEARLADGEFVIPADVVSHLGNGSTDAGAKQLYKMMDKVRTARTGRKAQGKQITPSKYMPA